MKFNINFYLKDNFRTALNIEEYFEQHNEKTCIFKKNAEKAFDYLNWTFSFKF